MDVRKAYASDGYKGGRSPLHTTEYNAFWHHLYFIIYVTSFLIVRCAHTWSDGGVVWPHPSNTRMYNACTFISYIDPFTFAICCVVVPQFSPLLFFALQQSLERRAMSYIQWQETFIGFFVYSAGIASHHITPSHRSEGNRNKQPSEATKLCDATREP